jgi:hypothetical protein
MKIRPKFVAVGYCYWVKVLPSSRPASNESQLAAASSINGTRSTYELLGLGGVWGRLI